MAAETTFRGLVEMLISRAGTGAAVAEACGLSPSAFSRGVRQEGTLGIESLLRLADWAGEPPARVLRLAGKGDVADLIEKTFGVKSEPITRQQRELLEAWRDLPSEARDAFSVLLRALLGRNSANHAHRKRA